jgi:predicted small lipoprotein YifL
MKITRLFILLIAFVLIAACGNKGDLVRPDAPASAESTDAPASAQS